MPKDIMPIIPLTSKTETKEVIHTARIWRPNGIGEIRFSIFDKANNYKTYSCFYETDIVDMVCN